jgi:hypothetical protein
MNRILAILAVSGLMLLGAGAALAELPIQAMKDGADYLITVQNTDGGFPWEGTGATANNITGPTAYGLLRYYELKGEAGYLDAAKNAGNYIKNTFKYPEGESRFATFDPFYCWKLSAVAGDSTWSDHAATKFFDELTAGTYGTANFSTAGWISAVQAGRAGTWINLLPWEFSTLAVTAANIGNTGQEALFRQGILDGLNTLDNTSPATVYSDLIGVAGGVRGLALDGVTAFTAISSTKHGGINGISTLLGLADYLAGEQNADGSWYWSDNLTTPGEDDKDTQITAYAVLALAAADALVTSDYADEVALGREWLVTMQKTSGGFYSYPGDPDLTNNEVSGEATSALPEPATMAFLAFGGIGMLLRRRRNK